MTDSIIKSLVETKRSVVTQVERDELSVKDALKLLHLSRSGFWKLRNNYRKYGSTSLTGRKRGPKGYSRVWNRTQDEVELKVVEIFNRFSFGPDRILWELEPLGVKLSRVTVYRILVRRRALITKARGKRPPPRLYAKGYPGEEVQIDGTEPYGKGRGWSLAAVDDYSRYALARLQVKNNSYLSAEFLKYLVSVCPFHITAVRVDNGPEFKKDFVKACRKLKITIIRNPPHHPTSNGKVERLHRTIEEECYWRLGPSPSLDETNLELRKYLGFYNERRRHQGFGMHKQTPKQRIERYLNQERYFQEENVYLTVIQYTYYTSV